MNGFTGVNKKQQQVLESYLDPKERLIWVDQPAPYFFSAYTTTQFIAGVIWTAMVVLIMADSYDYQIPAVALAEGVTLLVVFVFFLSFGAIFLSAPFRTWPRVRQTVYAITDRRALGVCTRRKQELLFSVPYDTVSQIRFKKRFREHGDVLLVCGVRRVGYFPDQATQETPGFLHIHNAETVARRLEELVERMGPEGTDAVARVPDDPDIKSQLMELLMLPLALGYLALMAGAVFGIPAFLAWATNTEPAGYLFFLLFLVMLLQLRAMTLARHTANWPAVQGIIEESYVVNDDDGYRPRVQYRYSVNDKEYWNNDITYKQRSDVLNQGPAEAVVVNYPEGSQVPVYYHPKKPGYSVLERGGGGGNWFVFWLLLICLSTAGVWMVLTWKGFDTERLTAKWQQVKQRVGLEQVNSAVKVPRLIKQDTPIDPDVTQNPVDAPPDDREKTGLPDFTSGGVSDAHLDLFFIAVTNGDVDTVRRYLRAGVSPEVVWPVVGDTSLVVAVASRRDEVAVALIEAGADVTVQEGDPTPLIWAAMRCQSIKLVQTMIAAGADVNIRGAGGSTPLKVARYHKCTEIEQMLLATGAR